MATMTAPQTSRDAAPGDEHPSPRRPGAGALAVFVLSVAVFVGVPIGWGLARPPIDAGTLPRFDVVAPEPAAARPETATDSWRVTLSQLTFRVPTPREEAPRRPAVVTRSARVGDVAVPAVVAPTRLVIPGLGVDAPVVDVGVTGDGLMEIPEDVDTVGWYRFGAAPGTESGSAVLTAHVDSRTQGPGVLFDLRSVPVGAPVTVTLADGRAVAYEVVARRAYPKAELPAEVFRRDGSPVLAIITCGGDFDPATRSYAENVVVYAAPTSS